tara:strand:+ start:347 stop:529 length:183 start_codon:yes stop_codon:yes gene_type:complete
MNWHFTKILENISFYHEGKKQILNENETYLFKNLESIKSFNEFLQSKKVHYITGKNEFNF